MSIPLDSRFPETNWTVVLNACRSDSSIAAPALERLCNHYRKPIHAFILARCSQDVSEAEDYCQAFFVHLIENPIGSGIQPAQGRFRALLLAWVKNFMANVHRKALAGKRGGAFTHVQFDENENQIGDGEGDSADLIYDREWALTLMGNVWQSMEEEYRKSGELDRLEALRGHMMGDTDLTYGELATRLQLTEAGVKSAAFRMRRSFRELFRENVAQIVENPSEVDQEMTYLLQVFAAHQ
jgi:DNA-directed RNA polymerase specialized sigma24 family protein